MIKKFREFLKGIILPAEDNSVGGVFAVSVTTPGAGGAAEVTDLTFDTFANTNDGGYFLIYSATDATA